MTIKEIADLCGVTEQTVLNWTHKIADDLPKNLEGLSVKLEEARKSGKDPADFTLDETIAIIGEGGGNKTLASLLAENAMNKNAVAVFGAYDISEDAVLGQVRQAVIEGTIATAKCILDMRAYKYTRLALCGKREECKRYTYENGGRVYAMPMSKCWTRFNVLVYNAWGKCVREGLAARERLFTTIENLVREYDMGKFITCERVDFEDYLDWCLNRSVSKPWGKLFNTQRLLPDSVLGFKTEKKPGAQYTL
jgi:DNA-binding Lrp family transcriptional regulator